MGILLFAVRNLLRFKESIKNNIILTMFYTFSVSEIILDLVLVWQCPKLDDTSNRDYSLKFFARCFAICSTWCQMLAFSRLALAFSN